MKFLFVDTGGWMMLADASDPQHRAAIKARDGWLSKGGVLVTSNYVMDETLTLLRMRLGLDVAELWWEMVSSSSRVTWEWIGPDRAEAARAWFFRWRDKEFSFTDCTSFVVMKERKLKGVLTGDKHFSQAGFQVLP